MAVHCQSYVSGIPSFKNTKSISYYTQNLGRSYAAHYSKLSQIVVVKIVIEFIVEVLIGDISFVYFLWSSCVK